MPQKKVVLDVSVPEEAIDEKTFEEKVNLERIGDRTAELSEDSDDGEDQKQMATSSRSKLITWYRRVRPLMRDRRVCVLTGVNAVLVFLNALLILTIVVLIVLFSVKRAEHHRRSREDKPCYYEWTEWSACNATCYNVTIALPTMRNRTVKEETIVLARGRFDNDRDRCPKNLKGKVDYAPCNTYQCPESLNATKFVDCYPRDAKNPDLCYEIRDIPPGDMLFKIDNDTLTQPCTCGTEDLS